MAEGDIVVSKASDDGLSAVIVCGPCVALSCCLYPWPNPDTPLWPSTDASATIVNQTGSIVLTLYNSPTYGPYTYSDTGDDSGTQFVYANDIVTQSILGFPLGNWVADLGIVQGYSGCLIGQYVAVAQVGDQFADTYLVNGLDLITFIPSTPISGDARFSCLWTGPKTGGGFWDLDYGISTPYKWSLNAVAKTDPQSSPVGSYGTDTVT